MRYLGLDLGTKTLGVSISDKTNTLVSPLKVLRFQFENYSAVLNEVKKIISDYNIKLVVLGIPKNMDGSVGFAGERSLKFKELLELENIKVELVDERLTTKTAEDIIHLNNENVKNTKNKIDSIAACVILESYLKRCQNDIKE
ncbi:MAG: Holliday junction resolvase RuvX [Firmicutes bacterium]|nr:Holliday junction resolvase RuvX [Bacillota bacterium]